MTQKLLVEPVSFIGANTTSEETVYSKTVPANTLTAGRIVRANILLQPFKDNGTTPMFTFRIRFGGVLIAERTVTAVSTGEGFIMPIELYMIGRGGNTLDIFCFSGRSSSFTGEDNGPGDTIGNIDERGNYLRTSAVDVGIDQLLEVRTQWGSAPGTGKGSRGRFLVAEILVEGHGQGVQTLYSRLLTAPINEYKTVGEHALFQQNLPTGAFGLGSNRKRRLRVRVFHRQTGTEPAGQNDQYHVNCYLAGVKMVDLDLTTADNGFRRQAASVIDLISNDELSSDTASRVWCSALKGTLQVHTADGGGTGQGAGLEGSKLGDRRFLFNSESTFDFTSALELKVTFKIDQAPSNSLLDPLAISVELLTPD